MNLLFPRFPLRSMPAMLGVAFLGALIGGIYGVFHDLLTYSISQEYFTLMKFHQFSYADFGWPPHWFAAEIGFIATGAVGLAAGWFLARIAMPAWPLRIAMKKIFLSFLLILVTTMIAGVVGYLIGLRQIDDYSNWVELCDSLGVTDIRAFVRVAYIHYASYIGGFIGLVLAILWLRRIRSRDRVPSNDTIGCPC